MALNTSYADETPVTIREGDTLPRREWTLLDRTGDPDDLTDAAEVRFRMADPTDLSTLVIDQPATIEDAKAGRVSYQFSAVETATPGRYVAEFVINPHPDLPGGETAAQRTRPAGGHIPVEINEDWPMSTPTGFGHNYGYDY